MSKCPLCKAELVGDGGPPARQPKPTAKQHLAYRIRTVVVWAAVLGLPVNIGARTVYVPSDDLIAIFGVTAGYFYLVGSAIHLIGEHKEHWLYWNRSDRY